MENNIVDDDDDEFGDLYADVEIQASSAINGIVLSSKAVVNGGVDHNNCNENEAIDESESEDDLNIVLNESENNYLHNEDENGGLITANSNGSDNSYGENKCYKYTRPLQAAYSSHLKADGASFVLSYSTAAVNGKWKDNGNTQRVGLRSAAQNGQNFSLPWSRNILGVNIDMFEKKPWRHPSADLTDYFNFGFDEDSWKQYCNCLDEHQEQAKTADKVLDYTRSTTSKPKGRLIEVEESIMERQPSTDFEHSQDRDSGVVIEIALQDSMEYPLNSPKEQRRASENGDVGENGMSFLCSTGANEDELPSLEGTEGGSGNATSERNTPVRECVSMDSDNYENCEFSDADEHNLQEGTECDVDETLGAIESSHDGNKSSEGDMSGPKKSLMFQEPLHGEGREHSPGSSCSQSRREISRDGAHLDFEKSRNHHLRALPNTESELQEKSTIDFQPLRVSKTHHMRTESVKKDLLHDRKKPGRISDTNPDHLKDKDSRKSDARILYERHNSTVIQQGKRDRWHDFDSLEREDTSHFKGAEPFYSYAGRISDYPRQVSYTKNPERKCQLKYRYDNLSAKSKLDPLELSISTDDELSERDQPHYGSRLTIQDVDNVSFHESEQLTDKYVSYLGDEKASPQMWKINQLKSNKRMRTDDPECNYIYNITEDTDNRYRRFYRDTNYLEDGYHVNLTYFRRETKSPSRGKRRENILCNNLNIYCMDLKDEQVRFDSHRPPSFRLCNEPFRASRWQSPSLPHGNRRRMFSDTRRCQDGGQFANLTKPFSANRTVNYPGNQDSFERRREYEQSEGLRRVEDEDSSRHQQNMLYAERISCSFRRTSSDRKFGSFDSKHGPNLVKKHLDDRHMNPERHNLMRKGNNASQFGQGFKFLHRDNHWRRFPSWRDSVDSGLVVDNRESSGRWSKVGGVTSFGRCSYLDPESYVEPEPTEGTNEPNFRKTLKARNLTTGCNENNIKRPDIFSDAQQEGSLDVEEGQIISEGVNEKTIKRRITYPGKLQISEMKNFDYHKKVEQQDDPRILEVMAKMEKRRERFNKPIALQSDSKNVSKPSIDLCAGTTEAMQPRPARKRRWVGS